MTGYPQKTYLIVESANRLNNRVHI